MRRCTTQRTHAIKEVERVDPPQAAKPQPAGLRAGIEQRLEVKSLHRSTEKTQLNHKGAETQRGEIQEAEERIVSLRG